MPHPRVVILGYSEAAMYLGRAPRPPLAGIISIHGRREHGVEAHAPHRLDLAFDDVEVPAQGDVLAMVRASARRRWASENGVVETPPTEADAAAIIDFARATEDSDGVVLCHCGGGMSRAPAAALICLAAWNGPGAEVRCAREVLTLRRGAVPHAGLVRFADQALGRNGALMNALQASRL
jgi:predicted protein tyrosine phosphatase